MTAKPSINGVYERYYGNGTETGNGVFATFTKTLQSHFSFSDEEFSGIETPNQYMLVKEKIFDEGIDSANKILLLLEREPLTDEVVKFRSTIKEGLRSLKSAKRLMFHEGSEALDTTKSTLMKTSTTLTVWFICAYYGIRE